MSKNEARISSGSTIGMDSKRDKWFSDLSQRHISWEELLMMKRAIGKSSPNDLPIDWILSAPKTVPFFRFMVSYLVYTFYGELATSSPANKDSKIPTINDYIGAVYEELKPRKQKHDKVNRLAECVFQAFTDNGCELNGAYYGRLYRNAPLWTRDDLYKKLFKAEELSLYDFVPIAFGLNMSLEDVNIFLTKALLRGELDPGDEFELLVFLTLAIAPGNKREFFDRLNLLYQTASAKSKEAKNNPCFPTVTLQKLVQRLVDSCNDHLQSDTLEKSELIDFFSLYKAEYLSRSQSDRTISTQFWELLRQFKENESERIAEFKRGAKEKGNEIGYGTVNVVAKPNKRVFIPCGTLWGTEPVCVSPGAKPCDPRICKSTEACIIDVKNDSLVEVIVPVESTTAGTGSISSNQTFSCSLAALHGANISNARGFRPAKDNSLPVKGNIRVKCKDGTVIPCGTRFTAKLSNTESYIFQSTETVEALRSKEITVEVTALNTDIAKGKLKHLIGDFATKENILRFQNKSITTGTKKKDKSENNDISSYLYQYGLHVLNNFSKEDDSEILATFDAMKTASALDGLLSGSALTASILSQIRARDRERLSETSGQRLDHLGQRRDKTVAGIITRKRFLTAAFLACGSKNVDSVKPDVYHYKKQTPSAQEVLSNSVAEINSNLRKCGFHDLYLPNPFDCLIAYLTMCADPIEAYRTLFDLKQDYSDKKKEEKEIMIENEQVAE